MGKGFKIKQFKEENPFEDEQVAKEWINSVENEKDLYRDKEVYPRLKNWLAQQTANFVVEIGSGQGICSSKLGEYNGIYVGVEPSKVLAQRAKKLYDDDQRQFVVGDTYHLPVESEKAEACFSVMVWFHLGNLDKASGELARVLKPGGKFIIITANPNAEKTWESFYFDYQKEGKKITGKINVPINPMSKSIIYQHSQDEILNALRTSGLEIEHTDEYGQVNGENIFFSVEGKKI